MPRPREFDETQALNQAMQVFWTQGYDATSLCDLLEAMELSRSSFYEAFGSKHELFLATIDHYNRTVAAKCGPTAIEKAGSPKAGIANIFHGAVEALTDPKGERRGCFVANCAIEVAPHDPAAAERVCCGLDHMESTFLKAVEEGQNTGEIPRTREARALARYLTSSLNGLVVMGKAKPDRQALGEVVRVVLSALD